MMKCAPAWRLLLSVLLAFSAAACSKLKRSGIDDEKDPHYLEGQRRMGGMDWDGAIQSFERALQSNPRNAAAHFQLGALYYTRKQDFAAAIYHYQRHLNLNPKSAMADLVRQQITFSKRELARTDSYPAVSRDVQRDLEKLVLSNGVLKERVELLEAELARRPAYITNYVTNFVKLPQFEQNRRSGLTAPAQIVDRPAPPEETDPEPPVRAPEKVARSGTAERTPRSSGQRQEQPAARGNRTTRTPARQTVHTVRPGETLQVLARRYGVSLAELKAANPAAARGVRAGQKINIPAK